MTGGTVAGSGKRELLLRLDSKYRNADFIPADPLRYVYEFERKEDREVAAFIASSIALGRRKMILATGSKIFDALNGAPFDSLICYGGEIRRRICRIVHPAPKPIMGFELDRAFEVLSRILVENGTLGQYFRSVVAGDTTATVMNRFVRPFVEAGCGRLVPTPFNGSACKRLCMFFRWMVRKDEVDPGLWMGYFPASKLIIPLDTSVGKAARKLKLTRRLSDSWRTAEEITANIAKYFPEDPARFDIALFSYGQEIGSAMRGSRKRSGYLR